METDYNYFSTYARKISDQARQFTNSLLKENDELRRVLDFVTGIEIDLPVAQEKNEHIFDTLEDVTRIIEPIARENEELKERLIEKDNALSHSKTTIEQIGQKLEKIERENRTLTDQFGQFEEQISNLANLYVSSYQIHGSLSRQDVLQAIKDTIINLIGSEEFGIYEYDRSKVKLDLISSFGFEIKTPPTLSPELSLISDVINSGDIYVSEEVNRKHEKIEDRIIACVPLIIEENVTGIIVLFSLLTQKTGFCDLDYELFDLLSTHAPMALYATKLHNRNCLDQVS